MKVKRTLPFNRNIYVTPPVLIPSTTDQDEDLDELLFALKNDSFVGSETSSIVSGKNKISSAPMLVSLLYVTGATNRTKLLPF
jgi:hypothetical protein